MAISEAAKKIISEGSVKVRVNRAGMFQVHTFVVKRVMAGNLEFVELFLNRVLDAHELVRVANELGLPIEAENGRAFPEGKGAKDFTGV